MGKYVPQVQYVLHGLHRAPGRGVWIFALLAAAFLLYLLVEAITPSRLTIPASRFAVPTAPGRPTRRPPRVRRSRRLIHATTVAHAPPTLP